MLDTMTVTKAAGGFCGAFLVYLLGGWAGEVLFHTGGGHGDHGEQAYLIEVEDAAQADADAQEAAIDFLALVGEADPGKGERVFAKCRACHKLDGTNGTGPHLDGVMEREIAAVEGYSYSDALAGLDGAWTAEALNEFLESPRNYAPGTKMSFAGLKKVGDRADLVAYLSGL